MADLLIRLFTDRSPENLPYCYPIERPQPYRNLGMET